MLQEPQGAGDVGREVVEWPVHRGPHTSQSCEVDHGVDALVRQAVGADVAAEGDAAVRESILGRDQVESDDLVARIAEMTHGVGADEAGRTGDEHGGHAPLWESTTH